MDFGKAFAYVFDDPDWLKKVGIAGLLMLVPIVGQFFVGGWALETTRRVIRRDEYPLADWSDFGGILVKGLQVFVIALVYALPIILVSACSGGLNVMLSEGGDDTMVTVATIVSLCLSCVVLLYAIFLALVVPAAMGNFAAKDQLGAAFRFGEVIGLVRAAPGPYIMAFLGSLVVGFIASLGVILCVIGVVFTSAYAAVVNGHLQGQAYNAAIEAQGAQAGSAF